MPGRNHTHTQTLAVALSLLFVSLALGACAPLDDDDPLDTGAHALVTETCSTQGDGALPDGSTFGFAVDGIDGAVTGTWRHETRDADLLLGPITRIVCRQTDADSAPFADVQGLATVDGSPGFFFDVRIVDRGSASPGEAVPETQTIVASLEPPPSRFHDGALVLPGPTATITLPERLDVTDGDAGKGWSVLELWLAGSGERVRCRYRGNGRRHGGGDAYVFVACAGHPELGPGTEVAVESAELRVRSARRRHLCTRTEVSVDILVDDGTGAPPPDPDTLDTYRLRIRDVDGETLHHFEGEVVDGDLQITLPDPAP